MTYTAEQLREALDAYGNKERHKLFKHQYGARPGEVINKAARDRLEQMEAVVAPDPEVKHMEGATGKRKEALVRFREACTRAIVGKDYVEMESFLDDDTIATIEAALLAERRSGVQEPSWELAFEAGYRACEKGESLQKAINDMRIK